MMITEVDKLTDLYHKLCEYSDERLALLRTRLEPVQPEIESTLLRGKLQEIKELKRFLDNSR